MHHAHKDGEVARFWGSTGNERPGGIFSDRTPRNRIFGPIAIAAKYHFTVRLKTARRSKTMPAIARAQPNRLKKRASTHKAAAVNDRASGRIAETRWLCASGIMLISLYKS